MYITNINEWWRHNDVWDRQQASGILLENFDGETAIYLQVTDDWWDDLSVEEKFNVYREFFEEA